MEDYTDRIRRAIEFLDNNIYRNPSLKELSASAYFSEFHFQRIFTSHIGITPGQYIKNRRLERSISKLHFTKESITKIALDSGYSSSANYSKAFKKMYGVSPRKCRESGEEKFVKEVVKKDNIPEKRITLEVNVENIEDLNVAYTTSWGSYLLGIPLAWLKIYSWVGKRKLLKNSRAIGVVHDNPNITSESNLRYDACLTVPVGTLPDKNIGVKRVPGGLNATILYSGSYSGLPELYNTFFRDWLPGSGYEPDNRPGFQLHLSKNMKESRDRAKLKICIPICKQN